MPLSISVNTEELRRHGDLYRSWLDGWSEQLQIIGETMADATIDQLGDMTPRKSGRASRAWQREVRGAGAQGARSATQESTLQLIYNEAPHYRYLTEGTGIYGPSRHLIVPKSRMVMVFTVDGTKVRARYTRGQRPQNIVDRLSESTILRIAEDHVDRYLRNYPK